MQPCTLNSWIAPSTGWEGEWILFHVRIALMSLSQIATPYTSPKPRSWRNRQKIQAMHIANSNNPFVTHKAFIRTVKNWEEKLDGKLATLASSINLNIDQRVETAMDILNHQAYTPHTTYTHTLVGSMAMEFQLSNQQMQGIVNNLATSLPHLYQQLPQGPCNPNKLKGSYAQLQAPPGFQWAPQTFHNEHQGFNNNHKLLSSSHPSMAPFLTTLYCVHAFQ